ncbi:HNH endonuclease family protein [Smaragdicoccus niigatensis]|uniref:HNH endonuclease family protein n=1 Tax=Smaragdicoccus niigatensis TaxID=359359 RepID=UPI00035FF38D|nr:HNH endonuclease family protein [Smaragdicoccus niigatensis]
MTRLAIVCTALVLAGCAAVPPAPGSPPRSEIERLLSAVRVVDHRPEVPGYERSCKVGDGCVFGPAWSDDTDAPGGHDGCDTRNNVLAAQLTSVAFKPGTHDCVVLSGILHDPYSGEEVAFDRSRSGDVQIDHVIPLAAAWDLGAAQWTLDKRMRFANDLEANLLAVRGDENQSKGDSTPGEWLPEPAYRCFYVTKYLAASIRYDLPVTAADYQAVQRVSRNC